VASGSGGSGGGGGGGGGGNGTGGGGGGGKTDPRLKKVFWALAYTPDWGLVDYGCNITQSMCLIHVDLSSHP
jgi:hypothetical protein